MSLKDLTDEEKNEVLFIGQDLMDKYANRLGEDKKYGYTRLINKDIKHLLFKGVPLIPVSTEKLEFLDKPDTFQINKVFTVKELKGRLNQFIEIGNAGPIKSKIKDTSI